MSTKSKVLSINSKEIKGKIRQYILDNIDSEGYGVTADTEKEKLEFLRKTFLSEYGHQLSYYKTWQGTFTDWLMGLPSSFNVEYMNYGIIQIAKEWNVIEKDADDIQEDMFIERWWDLIYHEFVALLKIHKIDELRNI